VENSYESKVTILPTMFLRRGKDPVIIQKQSANERREGGGVTVTIKSEGSVSPLYRQEGNSRTESRFFRTFKGEGNWGRGTKSLSTCNEKKEEGLAYHPVERGRKVALLKKESEKFLRRKVPFWGKLWVSLVWGRGGTIRAYSHYSEGLSCRVEAQIRRASIEKDSFLR